MAMLDSSSSEKEETFTLCLLETKALNVFEIYPFNCDTSCDPLPLITTSHPSSIHSLTHKQTGLNGLTTQGFRRHKGANTLRY